MSDFLRIAFLPSTTSISVEELYDKARSLATDKSNTVLRRNLTFRQEEEGDVRREGRRGSSNEEAGIDTKA